MRAWTSYTGAECMLDVRSLILALKHVHMFACYKAGPNYCTIGKKEQDRDNRQLACLRDF